MSDNKYANAPYNFIEFPDKVIYRYDSVDELPKHNSFYKNLNTGYIDYCIENKTPLFIGDEEKEKEVNGKKKKETLFFTIGDKPVIPGSTMRGRVRSNAEILSFSYPQFVEDRKFLYRDIAGETISKEEYYERLDLNEEYADISNKVCAGYLYKESNKFYIRPAKLEKGKSFYKVKEEFLIKKWNMGWNKFNGYNTMYFYKKENNKFLIKENKYFKAYETPLNINFNLNNTGGISKICPIEKENLNYKGKLYNSNNIKNKKNHYVVNEPDELVKKIEISDELIYQYEKDYKDNKIKNPFYYLPKEGEEKVFFYKLENENIKYFGRTPYLRMFYENSIKEIKNNHILNCEDFYDEINQNLKYKLDYSEALFGFSNKILKIKEKDKIISYKGRVNFGDLKKKESKLLGLLPANNGNSKLKELVLSNPKPTSFQLYLKQNKLNNKELTTYNQPNNKGLENSAKRIEPELRGQKFYWQRNEIENLQEAKNLNMSKNFKALAPKEIFKGRIYFENLHEDELGLLLLALKYDDDVTDNIGMGKPYGYGRIKIGDVKLVIEKKKESFKTFFDEKKDIIEEKEELNKIKEKFKINCLEKYNRNKLNKINRYDNIPIIEQYKLSKSLIENKEIERVFNKDNIKNGKYIVNELDYMEIEKDTGYKNSKGGKVTYNDFKDRKPLKDMNEYVKENKDD